MPSEFDIAAWMAQVRDDLSAAIEEALPDPTHAPMQLHEAMHHACRGGKRLRGLLVHACGAVVSAPDDALRRCAVAVELLHAYSLVHDDLPGMDNDTMRRGAPTVHHAWDEVTAILAGDALQALAFEHLARDVDATFPADRRLRCIAALALAAGSRGMCGGQSLDMAAEQQQVTLPELENIHILKTGELILSCARMAVACAGAEGTPAAATLEAAVKRLGLAFQVHDDLLDNGSEAGDELGKTAGKDLAAGKASFPILLGPGQARERLRELYAETHQLIDDLPGGDALRGLVARMEQRRH